MDVCPICGSIERTSPQFGMWQCINRVNRPYTVETPDQNIVLGPHAYGSRIERIDNWVTCGTRYSDTTRYTTSATQTCRCGLFAIGICSACGSPSCGPHSQMVDGSLTCDECIAERNAAKLKTGQEQARIANDARRREEAVRADALARDREAAIARGEPMDHASATRVLLRNVLSALHGAGSPRLREFPSDATYGRRNKVRAKVWGYEIESGNDILKHATDYMGPTETYLVVVTVDGLVLRITNRTRGGRDFGSDTSARTIGERDDEFQSAILRLGLMAAGIRIRFDVPWILTQAQGGESYARLRDKMIE
jgi:hypothetical protein